MKGVNRNEYGGYMKSRLNSKKKFYIWWDYNSDGNSIIVETSHKDYPVIATFPFLKNSSAQIEQAKQLIKDIKEGRKSLQNYP